MVLRGVGRRAPFGVDRERRRALRAPGGVGDRRGALVRAQAAGHRRVRLARLRRHLRRPRERVQRRRAADRVALQQSVRRRRRLCRAVHAVGRPALVARDERAGVARHRHRRLPHRSRQAGLQPRVVLAHVPLRPRRPLHAPLVSRAPEGERRRPGERAQLRRRPSPALAADRRRRVARDGDRPRRMGHRDGRRQEDRAALARSVANRPGQRHQHDGLSRPRPRRRPLDHGAGRRAPPDRRRALPAEGGGVDPALRPSAGRHRRAGAARR